MDDAPRPALSRRWLSWAAAAVLVAFLLDSVVYEFLHRNYNHHTRPVPTLLKVPTRVLRSLEDWGENIFVAAVLVVMWQLDVRRRSRVLCVVLAAAATTLSVEVVKRGFGRERPEVSQGKLVLHGPARWNDRLGDAHSFPSGHTASAGAYSGSLAAFYPPIRPVCVALVAGCGASRIWKERHFLSDCLFGGLLGYWFGIFVGRTRRLNWLRGAFDRRFSVSHDFRLAPYQACAA